jgi:hypothetical protein
VAAVEARIVPLHGDRRGTPLPLQGAEILLGRDPSVDLRFDHAAVSRRHAVLRELGAGHTLQDLGSSNGTRINGSEVRDPLLLRNGDRIELGGEITLLYEQLDGNGGSRWPLLAALGVVIAALLGTGAWFLLRPGASDLGEASRIAAEGLRAARSGDASTAKDRLRSAAGVLYKQGLLDDVPRGDVMRIAMQRLGGSLDPPADLWTLFQTSLEASKPKHAKPRAGGAVPLGCRLDRVGPTALEPCLRERIELVMIDLRQDPGTIPDYFPDKVGRRMRKERKFIENSLERGRPLIPMLKKELEAAKMPPLLHYLALIESGYKNTAVSSAKAMGLWQFMPGTGKQYGLKIGGPNDERRDEAKSTRAAARYLRDLAFEFGGDALLLALAGYNRGENGVRRALKKLDDPFSDRSYWRLVEEELLPQETADYVTRFIAAAVAGEGGVPPASTLAAAGY